MPNTPEAKPHARKSHYCTSMVGDYGQVDAPRAHPDTDRGSSKIHACLGHRSYIVHPPIALDRLRYDPVSRQVTYDRKNHDRPDSPASATCPALDFLAALCTHIPDAGQQLIK